MLFSKETDETQIESAEELEAETEDLVEVKEDDVREKIIEEMELNSEDDKELIEKMVKKEMGHRSKLSKTIGQKVKYRDGLKTKTKDGDKPSKETDASKKTDDADLDGDEKFEQRMNKRDLDEMEYPDEIKDVIKNVAKIEKISVKKAVSSPYVDAKIKAWEKAEGIDNSALSKKDNKKDSVKSDDDDFDGTPPECDLNTKEGRKIYDDWMKENIAKGH